MRPWRAIVICAACAHAATLDFAISLPLDTFSGRFGADPQGNILLADTPSTCTLPTVQPLSPCGPIWIAKLDPTGRKLLFATYLGSGVSSSVYTSVAGISADAQGNIIVAAHTTAPDMPVANAFQPAPGSEFTNLYVAKLASDGSRLIYGTYLGGSGGQSALSLAVDPAGSAYVAASVNSTDFPTTPQSVRYTGQYQTAIVKFDAAGKLQYSALFPFEFYTSAKSLAVDASGRAVLVSNLEALILAPDGSSLVRATYPAWATVAGPCISDATNSIASCGETPWAVPRSNGGLQFAGVASQGVPVTGNAMQISGEPNGHLEIQNGQAVEAPFSFSVTGFAVDPQNPARIFAASNSGLYLSTDNGATWTQVRTGPCLAVVVDPFDSNRIYLSLDRTPIVDPTPHVDRSTDGGLTWTAVYSARTAGEQITSFSADPNIRGLLYGAGPYLFRTTDGGDTWDARSVGPSMPNQSPSASTSTTSHYVQADPQHPGWAYVVGINACIGFCPTYPVLSRTQDSGNTWTDAGSSTVFNTSGPLWLAVDPITGDVVESPRGNPVIFRNGDLSKSEALYPAPATGIAFDAAHPGVIYLAVQIPQGAGSGYFIVESTDDGATWTTLLQLDRPAYNLIVSADGVLQASQAPSPPQAYFLTTDALGDVTYGTFFGQAFTQVNALVSSAPGTNPGAIVVGSTQGGLPLVDAAQSAPAGGADGFIAMFGDDGALLWSTYLGGSANDSLDAAFPLADGSVIVVGTTSSTDFPALQASPLGSGSTFIAHLLP